MRNVNRIPWRALNPHDASPTTHYGFKMISRITHDPSPITGSRGHYKLDAWKISRQLVSDVYRLSQTFPKEELFGLTAQLRRAAVSVPSNIAEGAARAGGREFAQFLNVARGSLSELETQLLIAGDLGYIKTDDPIFAAVDRVSRLITGLYKTIRNA